MTAIGPGTRVECINNNWSPAPGLPANGPSIGSKWTVKKVKDYYLGCLFLSLCEWPDERVMFQKSHFRPLDGDAEIERLRAIAANPDRIVAPPCKVKELT